MLFGIPWSSRGFDPVQPNLLISFPMLHRIGVRRPYQIPAIHLLKFAAGCLLAFATAGASAAERPPYLLQMIRDTAIARELNLDLKQKEKVDAAIAKVDPTWWVSRLQEESQRQETVAGLTRQLEDELQAILTPPQSKRLVQLQRQAHGTRSLIDPDMASELNLSDSQVQTLRDAFAGTDEVTAEQSRLVQEEKVDADEAAKAVKAAQVKEREAINAALDRQQISRMQSLVGKPFDFSTVKRTYPKAPSLIGTSEDWIGDPPPDAGDLRGKVVVVFFYAFQCINCQRNFPHYKAWQAELGDRGVVIIGIQTPETSSERDPKRVAAAHQKDQFDFPVLFDGQSTNWQAWGNTMWPTTYLVDKEGYIRRWWQGEMNWQGTPGEAQMRGTIEDLLAERD